MHIGHTQPIERNDKNGRRSGEQHKEVTFYLAFHYVACLCVDVRVTYSTLYNVI